MVSVPSKARPLVVPMLAVTVPATVCEAGKLETLTLPMAFAPAGRAGNDVTVVVVVRVPETLE